MKTTLGELVDSESSLVRLLDIKLPTKISYRISRVINKIKPDLTLFKERQQALIKELGSCTDKEKDNWKVLPENLEKYKKEISDLKDEEIDIGFDKIKLTDIGVTDIEPALLPIWLFEE